VPKPPDAPAYRPSIFLLTLARRVETALGEALDAHGLTVSRLGLLGHIAAVPGVSFSRLARMSGISVQSTHTAVRSLVAEGLVCDLTARAGAASAIELTDQGRECLERAMGAVAMIDDQLFGADADVLMRRIADAMRAEAEATGDRRTG
jgi:DNA-binding MarR family transcriptional regulator